MNGNDFIAWVLRSRLHGLVSGGMLLITFTGRKTGRQYTTPVGYYREGNVLWVITSRARTWWRNLRGGAEVTLRLRGRDVQAHAETLEEESAVARQIGDYIHHIPQSRRTLGVRLENGEPHPEDAARLAQERLFVKLDLRNGITT
jgi:deazaflavin-dependent oxidoreductase (nitroreductase family)